MYFIHGFSGRQQSGGVCVVEAQEVMILNTCTTFKFPNYFFPEVEQSKGIHSGRDTIYCE
jgi:hypothetical protein